MVLANPVTYARAASLAATHKGKVKNIQAAVLSETKEVRNPGVVIHYFENKTTEYDKQSKEQMDGPGMLIHLYEPYECSITVE